MVVEIVSVRFWRLSGIIDVVFSVLFESFDFLRFIIIF